MPLDKFIGNTEAKNIIKMAVAAAAQELRPVRHMLFTGPPGVGKTTLARIIAEIMGVGYVESVGHSLRHGSDILNRVLETGFCGIWFIDEIHLIPTRSQEIMLPLLQSFQLQTTDGMRYVPPFTCIGATTKTSALDDAFVQRFQYRPPMRLYNPEEIRSILEQNLNYAVVDPEALDLLISLCRGTPRVAISIAGTKLRDFCIATQTKRITEEVVRNMMQINQLFEGGLTASDVRYLIVLSEGKQGMETLIARLGDENFQETEAFLLREGYIVKTPRGREITIRGKLAANAHEEEVSR